MTTPALHAAHRAIQAHTAALMRERGLAPDDYTMGENVTLDAFVIASHALALAVRVHDLEVGPHVRCGYCRRAVNAESQAGT